jgi:hypothetical protein
MVVLELGEEGGEEKGREKKTRERKIGGGGGEQVLSGRTNEISLVCSPPSLLIFSFPLFSFLFLFLHLLPSPQTP